MNTDFRVAVDFFTHHKARKLKKRLGVAAVLSLLQLWAYAAKLRTDGNLSGMSVEDIELAAEWDGEEGAFASSLLDCGFLDRDDEGYLLHDWAENNPWVAEEKARSEQARKNAEARWRKSGKEKPQSGGNAPSEQKQCDGNAGAMQPQSGGNAPSPSPKPTPTCEELNTPPYPPEGGNAPEKEPDKPTPPKKTRAPTGNALPELRSAMFEYTQSEPLRKTLEDFRLMRERIRKPMTGQALRLLFRELDKLAMGNDGMKVAILEQSILNSWQGVFALKGPVQAGQVLSRNMETTAAVLAQRQQRRQGHDTTV